MAAMKLKPAGLEDFHIFSILFQMLSLQFNLNIVAVEEMIAPGAKFCKLILAYFRKNRKMSEQYSKQNNKIFIHSYISRLIIWDKILLKGQKIFSSISYWKKRCWKFSLFAYYLYLFIFHSVRVSIQDIQNLKIFIKVFKLRHCTSKKL